jgi:hypothetical protein
MFEEVWRGVRPWVFFAICFQLGMFIPRRTATGICIASHSLFVIGVVLLFWISGEGCLCLDFCPSGAGAIFLCGRF